MANAKSIPPKKPWRWRSLVQIRLRTLFLITLAVAIGCAWWLQPEKRERSLAGGELTVRAQGKLVEQPKKPVDPFLPQPQVVWVEHGLWELRDREHRLLCRGQVRAGAASGRWTWFHANGRRAAAGLVAAEVPLGEWNTWYESGAKESLVTFTSHAKKAPLEVFHGTMLAGPEVAATFLTAREGPATRWWSNGQVKEQGMFKTDLRAGVWTTFSESGEKLSEGEYCSGLREGPWQFFSPGGSSPRVVQYHAGLVSNFSNNELPGLAADLASGQFRRQHTASRRLGMLGEAAVPMLLAELKLRDARRRRLALEGLIWLGPAAHSAIPQLESFSATAGREDRRLARLALGRTDSERGNALALELWGEWRISRQDKAALDVARSLIWLGEPTLTCVCADLAQPGEERQMQTARAVTDLARAIEIWEEVSRPPYALSAKELEVALTEAAQKSAAQAGQIITEYYQSEAARAGFQGGVF